MMNDINAILELINAAIKIGGDIVPVALRAYAALKAETGMTDDELIAASRTLNDEDAAKLAKLIAETDG
jgi:hypothetical protein